MLAACAAIAYGAVTLHDQRRCASATAALSAPGGVAAAARDVARYCPGATALTSAAGALAQAGLRRDALLTAHEAVRREPRNYVTWAGLWFLLRSGHSPVATERARARTHQLDPGYAPTAPPRS